MDLANCYRLLGLTYGASLAEVKASYRRLARRYHPDVNAGDRLTQEKFIQLTEAYKLLLSVIKEPVGVRRYLAPPKRWRRKVPPRRLGVRHDRHHHEGDS
jgi:hypothetical protein